MKIRRARNRSDLYLELETTQGWVSVAKALARLALPPSETRELWSRDAIALIGAPADVRARIAEAARDLEPEPTRESDIVIPFEPRSFRDFMLYEAHAIAAARGFVRAFMPAAARVVGAYETLTRRTFPRLNPHRLWYRQPLYYMGNHLTIATNGDAIAILPYSQALDYELELGFVLAKPLLDAGPEACEAAIGGFVVLNDFSARDIQAEEMASGFGPQKSKHFASAISKVLVTADEILPRWRDLQGRVRLNGALIAEPTTAGAKWSLGEAIAHACRAEQLQAGELFGSGTLPGGSGIETGHLLKAGDVIEIAIDGIDTLSNPIVARRA
jgi:2-keto-4-pentenoate hydratase/2-oxohepta-3-ene-1,7-dioic acid hydratase in catechol pathway